MPQNPDDETQFFQGTASGEGGGTAPLPAGGAALLKDRYRIEKELGRGGFGVVYLARDEQLLSKPVVVKVLTQDYTQDSWSLKKFKQEMEALARIDHPGVVGALDTGQTPDGKPFLVMQFVEGITLQTQIREGGMELQRAAILLRQIGSALSAAHDKGIWHRDLKPENVMVQNLGQGEEHVKLIDFGIAAIADSSFTTKSQQTRVAGSFAYMAPEQFENKPCAQSDVYAMGVVAYEMVTGRHPFTAESLFQHMIEQQKGPAVKPRQLRPELPVAAEAVILRALAKEPAERYASPRELGEAFQQACQPGGGTTVAAPPPPPASVAPAEMVTSSSGRMEVAHVLFLDLVGYSTMPMDKQTEYLGELQSIVRATESFQEAEKSGNLIRLPTGDGMALIFFQDPVAPVECAVAIGRELKKRPHVQLRAGVHSGPVYRIADINTNMNVAGGGINMAQRVMDCGDAGHILVSATVADTLKQLSKWSSSLTDLGEHPVKHGVLVHLYNLCTEDAGNPAIPKKLGKAAAPPQSRRGVLVAAGVALAAIAAGAGYWLWPAGDLRTLTYTFTLKDYGNLAPDTVMTFNRGDQIRLDMHSSEAGHLYLLNEGPLEEGKLSFNVLHPLTGASSAMNANWDLQFPSAKDWLVFDGEKGPEKFYVVWSSEPVPELEKASSGQIGNQMSGLTVITGDAEMASLRALLENLRSGAEAMRNDDTKQTTIRSKKKTLAYLVTLQHR